MQKVHLWMEISADCPNRGRRSLTKMDRPGNVQSSVWTLQQILPDRPMKLYPHPIYHNIAPQSLKRAIDIPLPHWQSHFHPITQRAISLQKVHLWMEISAGCPNRGRRSLTKMDRPGNVQSSVWTLQQILPDRPMKLQNLYPIQPSGLTTKKLTNFHCVS